MQRLVLPYFDVDNTRKVSRKATGKNSSEVKLNRVARPLPGGAEAEPRYVDDSLVRATRVESLILAGRLAVFGKLPLL